MTVAVREINVVGPAGGHFIVMTGGEEKLFNDLSSRYTSDNIFQNVSDLQDLERIIHMEVLHLRYSTWISTESDYYGDAIDAKQLASIIKDFSMELRQLKKAVGIDKPSRQRESGETLSDYIEQLKKRAGAYGVKRQNQLTVALTLFNELSAKITLHDNCTEQERKDLSAKPEDILAWIRDTAIPEYEEIDAWFIEHQQKTWIQDQ